MSIFDSDLFTDIYLTILPFQVKGVVRVDMPRPFQMKDQPIPGRTGPWPFRNSKYIIFQVTRDKGT
jgi:hypothetical protein